MRNIFLEILNNSIQASYLIVVVMIIRILFKNIPKWSRCLLWAMVAVRLFVPFEIESSFSLVPEIRKVESENYQNFENQTSTLEAKDEDFPQYEQYLQNKNPETIDNTTDVHKETEEPVVKTEEKTFEYKDSWSGLIDVVALIWLLGILVFLIYAVFGFIKLKRKVQISVHLYDNVYLCDEIDSSFVMGIRKPCIYLSSKISRDVWKSILIHESTHIKRGDHIWKLLGYLLLMGYWFNPLAWFSYILFCKDIELACDEKVTKRMDKDQRAEYCEALLKCSIKRKRLDVCPVAFGEVGVKDRIIQVINYKKPSFWIIVFVLMICIVVPVCFMTNPKNVTESVTSSENNEAATEIDLSDQGEERAYNVAEYDHIRPDEQGYRWLTEEKDVYAYEFKDLDGNGVEEYAKVYQTEINMAYSCRYVFYWNGEAIYEYENSYGMSPGDAEYIDLNGDGENELVLTFWPNVNSMPLQEYIVLERKEESVWEPLEMIHGEELYENAFPISIKRGKNEWEAIISCKGLEKTISFDIAAYHAMLLETRENAPIEESEYWSTLINDYKYGYPNESELNPFGSVCAWGIWNIKVGDFKGQPCLIATHGLQGFHKSDFWGELEVYFNYDLQGKPKFLDMEFSCKEDNRQNVAADNHETLKKENPMEEEYSPKIIYEGCYFDSGVYQYWTEMPLYESPMIYCEIWIRNVTETTFDFLIKEVVMATDERTIILPLSTAKIVNNGWGAIYEGEEFTLLFEFPDSPDIFPKAITVDGWEKLEGNTYMNKEIRGHESG